MRATIRGAGTREKDENDKRRRQVKGNERGSEKENQIKTILSV